MKRFLAGLFGLLFSSLAWAQGPTGPGNNILCNQLAFQTASSSALLTLISGISGRVIYVCGWHVTNSAGAAQTFQLFTGTGTNCATASTALTPAYNVINSAPATDHVEFASISLAPGNNLCIQSSANSLQPGVWFSQY